MPKNMYSLIILILIAGCLASCLMLVSCNKKTIQKSVDSPDLKPEAYYTSYKQGFSAARFLETPYGTYFSSRDSYIYYSEKGNTKYIKLCNKPDCNHNTVDCNAYIKWYKIGYYDKKIYYITGNTLNCMDMDGSNHRNVKALYEGYDNNFGYFHNGYYYYVITKGGSIGAFGNEDNNLYRVKVDDDSAPEIVLTNDAILRLYMFTIVGDNIYIIEFNADATKVASLYSFSTISKKWTILTDNWVGAGAYYLDDDKGYCYMRNIGFYEYDLTTNEMNLVKPTELDDIGTCSAFYYPDYIYLIHYNSNPPSYQNQILYIYDRDYNLIDSIKFDKVYGKSTSGGFIGDVDKYVIFSSNYNEKPDFYIDKSEIGTGNLMFHKIED
ncbi:MAG TPA: hypothetical protein PL054_07795 [Clostridia bacterium]|jgi:hypothetical protein|nr:hypothetical protein [Clostridia bacterium]